MKIAILNCLKANDVCTGEACLTALRERSGAFSAYRCRDAELAAFLRCNGCGGDPERDPGMLEKLDRLRAIGTDTLHLGVCTVLDGAECPTITKLAEMAEKRGIRVVRGTHASRP